MATNGKKNSKSTAGVETKANMYVNNHGLDNWHAVMDTQHDYGHNEIYQTLFGTKDSFISFNKALLETRFYLKDKTQFFNYHNLEDLNDALGQSLIIFDTSKVKHLYNCPSYEERYRHSVSGLWDGAYKPGKNYLLIPNLGTGTDADSTKQYVFPMFRYDQKQQPYLDKFYDKFAITYVPAKEENFIKIGSFNLSAKLFEGQRPYLKVSKETTIQAMEAIDVKQPASIIEGFKLLITPLQEATTAYTAYTVDADTWHEYRKYFLYDPFLEEKTDNADADQDLITDDANEEHSDNDDENSDNDDENMGGGAGNDGSTSSESAGSSKPDVTKTNLIFLETSNLFLPKPPSFFSYVSEHAKPYAKSIKFKFSATTTSPTLPPPPRQSQRVSSKSPTAPTEKKVDNQFKQAMMYTREKYNEYKIILNQPDELHTFINNLFVSEDAPYNDVSKIIQMFDNFKTVEDDYKKLDEKYKEQQIEFCSRRKRTVCDGPQVSLDALPIDKLTNSQGDKTWREWYKNIANNVNIARSKLLTETYHSALFSKLKELHNTGKVDDAKIYTNNKLFEIATNIQTAFSELKTIKSKLNPDCQKDSSKHKFLDLLYQHIDNFKDLDAAIKNELLENICLLESIDIIGGQIGAIDVKSGNIDLLWKHIKDLISDCIKYKLVIHEHFKTLIKTVDSEGIWVDEIIELNTIQTNPTRYSELKFKIAMTISVTQNPYMEGNVKRVYEDSTIPKDHKDHPFHIYNQVVQHLYTICHVSLDMFNLTSLYADIKPEGPNSYTNQESSNSSVVSVTTDQVRKGCAEQLYRMFQTEYGTPTRDNLQSFMFDIKRSGDYMQIYTAYYLNNGQGILKGEDPIQKYVLQTIDTFFATKAIMMDQPVILSKQDTAYLYTPDTIQKQGNEQWLHSPIEPKSYKIKDCKLEFDITTWLSSTFAIVPSQSTQSSPATTIISPGSITTPVIPEPVPAQIHAAFETRVVEETRVRKRRKSATGDSEEALGRPKSAKRTARPKVIVPARAPAPSGRRTALPSAVTPLAAANEQVIAPPVEQVIAPAAIEQSVTPDNTMRCGIIENHKNKLSEAFLEYIKTKNIPSKAHSNLAETIAKNVQNSKSIDVAVAAVFMAEFLLESIVLKIALGTNQAITNDISLFYMLLCYSIDLMVCDKDAIQYRQHLDALLIKTSQLLESSNANVLFKLVSDKKLTLQHMMHYTVHKNIIDAWETVKRTPMMVGGSPTAESPGTKLPGISIHAPRIFKSSAETFLSVPISTLFNECFEKSLNEYQHNMFLMDAYWTSTDPKIKENLNKEIFKYRRIQKAKAIESCYHSLQATNDEMKIYITEYLTEIEDDIEIDQEQEFDSSDDDAASQDDEISHSDEDSDDQVSSDADDEETHYPVSDNLTEMFKKHEFKNAFSPVTPAGGNPNNSFLDEFSLRAILFKRMLRRKMLKKQQATKLCYTFF